MGGKHGQIIESSRFLRDVALYCYSAFPSRLSIIYPYESPKNISPDGDISTVIPVHECLQVSKLRRGCI